MSPDKKPGRIFSIGGGKGGVGKSVLAIALGAAFARSGSRVILADLDLGAANLHTYLGITKETPTIADFILNKVKSLDSLIIETHEKNLGLISGAEFVPGMANPAHWMKLKLMRHLKALPADYVIIDLGAGVHLNTLDFFGISDRGIIITEPQPGAILNAYGFIKAALFRRMQNVFKNHEALSGLIEEEIKGEEGESKLTLSWFSEKIGRSAPELLPLIDEIKRSFRPALVINRAPGGRTHMLVNNLITLCAEKLGVEIEHAGDLPDVKEFPNHLLNVPRLFDRQEGRDFFSSASKIAERLTGGLTTAPEGPGPAVDFSDEERDIILKFIDSLDERVFGNAGREIWKLRMFFKPSDVVSFLVSRGIRHDLFHGTQ